MYKHTRIPTFKAATLVIFLISFLAPTPAAAAGLCYVDETAGGANEGTTWNDAYKRLQSALADANCNEIWVAQGIYEPTTGTDRTVSFVLESGVEIYGGFAGMETLLSQRDWVTNPTILSGDLNEDDAGFTNKGENSYHVVIGGGADSTAVLDGFTLRGGNANSSFPDERGGGMYNDNSSPTLANLTFSSNSASFGGGIYNIGSSPSLTNVTFGNNTATNQGGGMINVLDSSPSLTNVTFSDNSALNDGGGMFNALNSHPSLANVTFSGNSAADDGGGMYSEISNPSLTNVTFNANIAFSNGDGIYNNSSSPTLSNTILWGDGTEEIFNFGTSAPSVTDSVVQGGYTGGTNIITTDPLLGPLQDNGGFTQTMALGVGSSAIDAGGANSACASNDQRGVARPQGAACDIGAYELEDTTAPTVISGLRADPDPTSAASVDFTLTFSEPVTGVDETDFDLTITGGISGVSVSGMNGSDDTYTISVNTGTGDGTIRLDVVDDDSIVDDTANPLGGAGAGNGNFTSGQAYTMDKNDAPTNISLSDNSIDENQPASTLVGNLSTTDPDAGDTFTYSFCGGLNDASFQISGSSLRSAEAFDFETQSSYSICIRSTDSGSLSTPETFAIGINNLTDTSTFADVPLSHWAWQYIEAIYSAGVTGGCEASPLNFCPDDQVTRAQMAVFLLKAIHGPTYAPPPVGGGTGFDDVPVTHWAAAWIKQLAAEGITGGCSVNLYCPEDNITRAQMAVFLLRSEHGASYTPPPVGGGTGFDDVPAGHWAAAWIKQLAAEGITGGCGGGNYCPEDPVTRAQMAVLLQRTFNIPLP